MGQNNDTTEHGDLQGNQGGQVKLPPGERKRQSGDPPSAPPTDLGSEAESLGGGNVRRPASKTRSGSN